MDPDMQTLFSQMDQMIETQTAMAIQLGQMAETMQDTMNAIKQKFELDSGNQQAIQNVQQEEVIVEEKLMISPADSGEVEGGDAEVDELEKFMAIPVDSDDILGDKSPPAPEDIPIPLFQILQQTVANQKQMPTDDQVEDEHSEDALLDLNAAEALVQSKVPQQTITGDDDDDEPHPRATSVTPPPEHSFLQVMNAGAVQTTNADADDGDTHSMESQGNNGDADNPTSQQPKESEDAGNKAIAPLEMKCGEDDGANQDPSIQLEPDSDENQIKICFKMAKIMSRQVVSSAVKEINGFNWNLTVEGIREYTIGDKTVPLLLGLFVHCKGPLNAEGQGEQLICKVKEPIFRIHNFCKEKPDLLKPGRSMKFEPPYNPRGVWFEMKKKAECLEQGLVTDDARIKVSVELYFPDEGESINSFNSSLKTSPEKAKQLQLDEA